MEVTFQMEGREAIPVRALPWSTGWEFGAGDVASALDRHDDYPTFWTAGSAGEGLRAYRLIDGKAHEVERREWARIVIAVEEVGDAGHSRQQWEAEATRALPAGVFVWRNEWERAYDESAWGPANLKKIAENADDYEDVRDRRIDLGLGGIPVELHGMVMAGFECPDITRCAVPTAVAHATKQQSLAQEASERRKMLVQAVAAPETHKTKRRADGLTAVLAMAELKAADSTDWQSVWAALVALAQSAARPAPLMGYVEGEGVKYQTDKEEQPVGYFTRDACRQRFNRKG